MTWIAAIPIAALVFAAATVAWAAWRAFTTSRDDEADWHLRPMVLWTAIATTLAMLFLPAAFPTAPGWRTSVWCIGMLLVTAHLPAVIAAQWLGASRKSSHH